MRMDREKLNRYKKNKRELAMIERQVDRLYERLEDVRIVKRLSVHRESYNGSDGGAESCLWD